MTQDEDGQSLAGDGTFWKSKSVGKGHEQALIATICKETKWTEELEEAGYRLPTWALLRALQQIHSATRIEGEATNSDVCPSSLSISGIRRSTLLGEKKNHGSIMGEPITTRKGKWAGRGKHNAPLGRVVQVKKRGGGNPVIWAQRERNLLWPWWNKMKEEKNQKKSSKKKVHRGQNLQYRSWCKQSNIKMAMSEDHASCWVHKDLTVTTKQIQALLTAARASGGKDKCQVRLTGIERECWMGTEIGRLGGYSFGGTVTAGDGSNPKDGKMGAAGYVNLRKKRKRQQRKMGRKEEGSSSNLPELAAFVLTLRGTPVTKLMLYLCDNQALLKPVKRWVG